MGSFTLVWNTCDINNKYISNIRIMLNQKLTDLTFSQYKDIICNTKYTDVIVCGVQYNDKLYSEVIDELKMLEQFF